MICGVICAGLAFGLGYLVCCYTSSSIYAAITKEENPYVSCAQMIKRTTQDSITVEYPYLNGEDAVSLKINEQIFHILFDDCLSDDEWTDRADIAYEITYMDEKVLSIYFRGEKQKGISTDGGNFEIGLNFNLESGELLRLADFYSMEEYQNLITNAVEQDKIGIGNEIPAERENECLTYMNSCFINYFIGDNSYIYETTNFFIREGKLCFLAEPLPSMNQLTIVEMEIDSFVPGDNIKQMNAQKETSEREIVVGEDFFLVLYDDGSVWSWGNNEEGKLGIAESFVSEPQRIEGLEHVVKLEDGGENVFALTEQGDVYTWGVKENVIPMKPVDSSAHIDTPFMMQNLKNIADITAENGKLYALNKDGSLYVSDYPWVYGSFTNFSPLQEDVMLGEIGCMQAGAGNYDYFVRTDGSIFSLMSFFYEGYNSNAYAFIFPHEGEVEPGKNNVIAWPPLPEDIPEITVLSEGGKYECLIYYDLKGVEGVKTVSSDPYTVFLSKENGTLYYWNSDRIKYHDKEFVLTHPDTLREQCNGEFVEIRVADILDIDDAASGCPQIISIKSGKENTMFLTDDGQVFISKYEAYDTADVEYGLWQVANPDRDLQTATYYDMALKELTFQKLELTDIQSIWTNGENCFCAVDSGGGYYRIVIEDNLITQTYLGLLPRF